MGIFYPNFPMMLPLRPVTCFAPPLQAIFAPCGPFMGVLTVMHFSHLFLHDRYFAPLALFSFYSRALARLYLDGFSLQSCYLSDLMALVSSYSRATGQSLFHRFQFAVLTLVRLYFIVTVSNSP